MQEMVVRIIAAQLSHDVADVRVDHDIFEHLGATSIDVIEIALDLEAAFGIDLHNDKIHGIQTIGCAVRLVETVQSRDNGGSSRDGERNLRGLRRLLRHFRASGVDVF